MRRILFLLAALLPLVAKAQSMFPLKIPARRRPGAVDTKQANALDVLAKVPRNTGHDGNPLESSMWAEPRLESQ
jgi:hypothetical protein